MFIAAFTKGSVGNVPDSKEANRRYLAATPSELEPLRRQIRVAALIERLGVAGPHVATQRTVKTNLDRETRSHKLDDEVARDKTQLFAKVNGKPGTHTRKANGYRRLDCSIHQTIGRPSQSYALPPGPTPWCETLLPTLHSVRSNVNIMTLQARAIQSHFGMCGDCYISRCVGRLPVYSSTACSPDPCQFGMALRRRSESSGTHRTIKTKVGSGEHAANCR